MTTPSRFKRTMITCPEASKWKCVAPSDFIWFRGLKDLYEKQPSKQFKHNEKSNTPKSYKESIENDDLVLFVNPGLVYGFLCIWGHGKTADTMVIGQIRTWSEWRATISCAKCRDTAGNKKAGLGSWRKNLLFAPRLHFHLKIAVYGDLSITKPHIAMKRILKRTKAQQLQARMMDKVQLRKNENFEKLNFSRFMCEQAAMAKKTHTEITASGDNTSISIDDKYRKASSNW